MVDNIDRETYRCWKVILEIERFISTYGGNYFETRKTHAENYYRQLLHLLDKDQIFIERNSNGDLISVCGWARIHAEDRWRVNKVNWTLPEEITQGELLYISFCVVYEGDVHNIRRELRRRCGREVSEVYWFNAPNNRFVRLRNVLKDNYENQNSVAVHQEQIKG